MSKAPHMATIQKAAEETGLSQYMIRGLCKTGQIVAVKSGAKWIVNVDKLIDYLNNPTPESTKEAPAYGSVQRI